MSRAQKVTINSVIMGAQHIVVNLISIFVVGYVARALGENDYGIFSLAFTFPQFFMIIGNFGTRSVAIREMANDRDNAISFLGSILPMRSVLLVCMLVVTPSAAYLMGYTGGTLYVIFLATVSLVIELFARIVFDVFQAFEKMGKIAIRDVVIRLFTGLTSVLVLFLGYGLVTVCYVYVVGACLGLFLNLIIYRKQFPWPTLKIDKKKSIQILKMSAPFAFTGFISALYVKVDILMLSKMVGSSEVGLYNAAANLIYRLTFVSDAIATAAFPAIAQLFWTHKDKASQIANDSLTIIFILSLPVTVGGFILSNSIISLIYGDGYVQSAIILKILISTIPFMFVNVLFSYMLGAIKRQNIVLIISIVLSISNIAINFILIPLMSAQGAGYATLATEILSTCIYSFYISKYFKINISYRTLFSMSAAVFLMGLSVSFFIKYPILINIPISASCYFIVFSLLAGKKYNIFILLYNKYSG